MAVMSFYEEPVILSKDKHRNLRLIRQWNYDFASSVNSVPLTAVEFAEASRDFPIFFVKIGDESYSPVAILSLKETNDLQGLWGEVYVPAFIRRYPFAITEDGTVVLDEKAPHVSESGDGDPLFDDNGEDSEALKSILKFLTDFDLHARRTAEFCKACEEGDLFTPFDAQVGLGDGKATRLKDLYVIDQEKLAKFSDEQILQWFHKGWVSWLYAHLHSLGSMRYVVKRQRAAESKAAS